METRQRGRRIGILAAIAELLPINNYRNIGKSRAKSTTDEKTLTNKVLRSKRGKSSLSAKAIKRNSLKIKNRRKYKAVVRSSRAK